ncbi:MAG: GNAT family N-acetyltransferase [Pseudomonadota bacterium]
MTENQQRYPTSVTCDEHIFNLRLMTAADEENILSFARKLPPHDLLYVPRDITNAKVVSAWVRANEKGHVTTVLAMDGDEIAGCAALFQDPLSWSPHWGEMRVLVSKAVRDKGLGRILIQECFLIALEKGLKKLSAQMTVDQQGAVAIFEELGFRGEALLKDQVIDRDGETHDIVVLSCNVEQIHARLEAYGVNAAVENA